MPAQPLLQTQELVDKINSFTLKARKVSDFEIRLLEREVNSLKRSIDHADYYDLLGRISSLENDEKGMARHFENAIKLAPTNHAIHGNYIKLLRNRGLMSQAMNQAIDLFHKFPNNSESLSFLIEMSLQSYKFRETLQLLNNLDNPEDFYAYKFIKQATSIFEAATLTDDEAQYLHDLAFSIIKNKNLYFSGCESGIIEGCVICTIYVDSPIEDIFDINWDLDRVLVENLDDTRSDILLFQYSSIDVLEEKENYERII